MIVSNSKPQANSRIPAYLITGFLGSGKTTLLSKIIQHPQMSNTALIVNELGEIGIDHMLVEKSDEDMVLLNSGCLCCAMLNTLPETLRDLESRRVRNEIPAFDRVIIETTGLAEPAPIVRAFASNQAVAKSYELKSVITVVDAVFGFGQLKMHPEVLRQVTAADEIVISKIDIASREEIVTCRAHAVEANPSARIHEIKKGEISNPVEFLGEARPNRPTSADEITAWLGEDHVIEKHGYDVHADEHTHGHHHSNKIKSFSIELDKPIAWAGYACWVDLLRQIPAQHLLRVKGLLNIHDVTKPAVIHAIQHLFYPPTFLNKWPTRDRKSKIVLITWDLDNTVLERTLMAFDVPNGCETKLNLAQLLQEEPKLNVKFYR